MNNKAILGISLGAVFAISMIMSPAFAGGSLPEGTIIEAVLKDHAEGKKPANNPAHYELIVETTGNYTAYAVDQTQNQGEAAVGFGIINGDFDIWAFTSHSFNDCGAPGCGNYFPHGHSGTLITTDVTGDCVGLMADLELTNVADLGEAKLTVKGDGTTEIELDDIPADAAIVPYSAVCNDPSEADIADVTAFTIQVGDNNALCVFADALRSNSVVEAADGPDNRKRDGGFTSINHPELCGPPA